MVAVRTWPVVIDVAVTVTFGMEAPEGSFTTPARPEVPADCARSDGAATSNNEAIVNNCTHFRLLDFIGPHLSFQRPPNVLYESVQTPRTVAALLPANHCEHNLAKPIFENESMI